MSGRTRRTARHVSHRQAVLLRLLAAVGGTVGNLDFQKLLFLYCQELESGAPYEFVPYRFGAFSFTSYADRRKLVALGLIENTDHEWVLTAAGREASGPSWAITDFAARLSGLTGDALVAKTYREYPYYALRSEIAQRVLKGDGEALERIKAQESKVLSAPLLTIGYEGRSLEAFLNALIRAGVTVLCDVRRNPLSRKYGFSKSTLATACGGVGVRYEHLPQLGIASEDRQELDSQDDYDALFARYRQEHLPHQGDALQHILDWIRAGDHIALTCYEHMPAQCHRHCVAEALEKLGGGEFLARHL